MQITPTNPTDCIIVAYAFRDGNQHELFYAFDEEAAEDAEIEAEQDHRFGRVGADVLFAILREEG